MVFGALFHRDIFFKPEIKKFIRRFGGNGGHNLDEAKGTLGYALMHYAFITNLRPNRILCVGSQKGFIPAILALACKENGTGHVDFVDPGYDRDNPNHWGGVGFWKKHDANKHFGRFGLGLWITTHVMTSAEFARKNKRRWQYVYVDGDHSYEGAKLDYKLFWPFLDRGGYMAFHDILLKNHPEHPNFGVWKFWNELRSQKKITIPFTYSQTLPSGLGIVQK